MHVSVVSRVVCCVAFLVMQMVAVVMQETPLNGFIVHHEAVGLLIWHDRPNVDHAA